MYAEVPPVWDGSAFDRGPTYSGLHRASGTANQQRSCHKHASYRTHRTAHVVSAPDSNTYACAVTHTEANPDPGTRSYLYTPIPPAVPGPTVERLRERAQGMAEALNSGDWSRVYEYSSSRSKAVCGEAEFVEGLKLGMEAVRWEIWEGAFMTFSVADVYDTAEAFDRGEKGEEGTAKLDWSYMSVPLGADPYVTGSRWVWQDGEWWREEENWDAGCPTPETGAFSTETPVALALHGLGDTIRVDAGALADYWLGRRDPAGEIVLNFRDVKRVEAVEETYCGDGTSESQGVFVAVYYTVFNDANSGIDPPSQIQYDFVMVDDREREWIQGAYLADCDLETEFINMVDGNRPVDWVGPGFDGTFVMVFDLPKGATGLRVESETLGLAVDLGESAQPEGAAGQNEGR